MIYITSRERIVLNSADRMIRTLLAAAGLSLATVEARADLFDVRRPKPAAAVARSQSPEGRTFGAGTYSQSNLWQPQQGGSNSPSSAGAQSGTGYATAPAGNYANYDYSGAGATVNCGECDRHQGRVSFCRKLCHQTYYPRSAPYCLPDWGWNQTCWRRMKDNYNCPRPDWQGSCPEIVTPLSPQAPVVPPATTYLPPPPTQVNRPVSYGERPSYAERPSFGERPSYAEQLSYGEQRQSLSGHAPLRARAQSAPSPEPATETGEWDYEEEAPPQPVTAPPRGQGRAYYLSPGVRR